MAIELTRTLTFIYHSHKIIDGQGIALLSANQDNHIQFIDLANSEISIGLLREISLKLPGWQRVLLDSKYMDRSIKDPENEFLLMDDLSKIIFLKNNSWLIGTPIIVDKDTAYRFRFVSEIIDWLNSMENTTVTHLIHQTS